jgi:hypothetical protein
MSSLNSTFTNTRRLQVILVLLIVWDVIGLLAEISIGGPLVKLSNGEVDGVLAARASLSGAYIVPILVYFYALVRGPARHTGVLWLGVFEQGAAALFAVLHVAASDLSVDGMLLPLIVSLVLMVLLLINMPRGQSGV